MRVEHVIDEMVDAGMVVFTEFLEWTVTADIDLGFNTWRRNEHLRLWGIDTPELRGPDKAAGRVARDALAARILGKAVTICTIKDKQEKFGRYLVKIYVGDELINDWLVRQG